LLYLEIFLKTRGSSWKFVECRIIVEKDRGLNEKVARIFGFELFSNGKGVNYVHGSWTAAPVGSPWTKNMPLAGISLELLLPTDSGHRVLTRDGEKGEGATGAQFCLLPRLGWR
jgi:hypothetical protein